MIVRSHVETLRWLYEEAENALAEATPDRKSALIGQLRLIAKELAELNASAPTTSEGGESSGLIDFQKALVDRQSKSGRSRRPGVG